MPHAQSAAPIFIVGTERSGSNLLRLMLNAHSRIAVPHPPHFMRYLAPLAEAYGDLSVEANRRRLTRDALRILNTHIHPWPHRISAEQVVAEAGPTVFGVVAAIYEQYRKGEGKQRWGCKSTFTVDYVDDILAERPDARFIWLVREPRDVAASAKRSVFGHCHPHLTARLWAAQQARASETLDRWGPDVVHLLHYEGLVRHPEAAVERMCGFLGERVEPGMLAHHESAAARLIGTLSDSWRNAAAPLSASRVGSHRGELTPRERAYVESIAGPLMARLRYPVDGSAARVAPPSMARVHLVNIAQRVAVECRSLRTDRNAVLRWRRDLTVQRLRLFARLRIAATRLTSGARRTRHRTSADSTA